jgi:hypothetical protein
VEASGEERSRSYRSIRGGFVYFFFFFPFLASFFARKADPMCGELLV